MVKKQKSSASAGTRKKHAAKKEDSTTPQQNVKPGKQAPQKKKYSKKHGLGQAKPPPPPKRFIPPPKPPRPAPDPLESMGLAHILPADLVVILSKLSKKDAITKIRAVEDLVSWVKDVDNREGGQDSISMAIPVWLHHLASMLLSSNRRLRQISLMLNLSLLSPNLPEIRSNYLYTIGSGQYEQAIGSWFLANPSSWLKHVTFLPPTDENDDRVNISEDYLLEPILNYISISIRSPSILIPGATPLTPAPGTPISEDAPRKDKLAEQDESSSSRDARIKSSGLLSLAHLLSTLPPGFDLERQLSDLFESGDIWNCFGAPEGDEVVRRSAWSLLIPLVKRDDGKLLEPYLEPVSKAVIFNAFEEDDPTVISVLFDGFLPFLRKYPQSWLLADEDKENEENENESDEENDKLDDENEKDIPKLKISKPISLLFTYLQLGCRGNPQLSYPSLLVIFMTIPKEFLNKSILSPLVVSFLAPLYSNIFQSPYQVKAAQALFNAVCECLTAIILNCEEFHEDKVGIFKEWIKAIWDAYITHPGKDAKKVDSRLVGNELAKTFVKTHNAHIFTADIVQELLTLTVDTIKEGDVTRSSRITEVINILLNDSYQSEMLHTLITPMLLNLLLLAIDQGRDENNIESTLAILQSTFNTLRNITSVEEVIVKVDDFILISLPTLLRGIHSSIATDVLLAYISKRNDPHQVSKAWKLALESEPSITVLSQLLEAENEGKLDHHNLSPSDESSINEIALSLASKVIEGNADSIEQNVIIGLFKNGSIGRFISPVMLQSMESLFAQSFSNQIHNKLYKSDDDVIFDVSIATLLQTISHASKELHQSISNEIFSATFLLDNGSDIAQSIWKQLTSNDEYVMKAKSFIINLISDINSNISPSQLLQLYFQHLSSFNLDNENIKDILVQRLEQHLSSLSFALPTSLSVLDSLVLQVSNYDENMDGIKFDQSGCSAYIRNAQAILTYFTINKNIVYDSKVLKHIFTIIQLVSDEKSVRKSTKLFEPSTSISVLDDIFNLAKTVTSFILLEKSNNINSNWHTNLISKLRKGEESNGDDVISDVLLHLWNDDNNDSDEHNVYNIRLFRNILEGVMIRSEPEQSDSEKWLGLVQEIYTKNENKARAIMFAVKDHALQAPRLSRIQNELASNLTSVKPSQASEIGLPLLRLLISSAPPLDSTEGILPQQRTIFLLRCLREWVMSDEDLDEELDVRLAELFIYVLPIIQEVEGAHWDLIFDLIEANIEIASLEEPESHNLLYQSLKLFDQLMYLSSTNSKLTDIWYERRSIAFEHIKTLFLSLNNESYENSLARKECEKLLLKLVQEIPKSLISKDTFEPMINMLYNSSVDVQKVSYKLLSTLSKELVETVVVESAIERKEEIMKLPTIIMEKLLNKFTLTIDDIQHSEQSRHDLFSTFLLWNVTFDHFSVASDSLKAAYNEQFRKSNVISNVFLPMIFTTLGLLDKGKVVDLSPYAIDEIYIEYFDIDDYISLAVFGGYLFYRALKFTSSQVRNWWSTNQNKQLQLVVNSFTSKYFSPVIVSEELSQLRNKDVLKSLQNESFSIKIATNASEVMATYIVDDQPMEMGIKLPQLFPLEPVEVRNIRRVGVNERQWRAWLLSVQQVIGSQSGPLLEALGLFKRNISLHFEGVTECAICYSIVQTSDRSLPSKKCKVCSHKFHAACLYTWFQSSTSSTCPLCRQIW